MTRGLALSGGGARGIAHIGVLKALDEFGITYDQLSGTSAGSIVGVLYSYGYKPDEIFDRVKNLSLFKSLRPAWAWTGLLTMEGMKQLLTETIPENDFAALKIPLTVAATDIRMGTIHYFTEGELIPAIISSCSIPAIFNPVSIKDHLFVDGGLLDNLPVAPIRDKCDFMIGCNCNHVSSDFDVKNMKNVLERSLLITINANTISSRAMCDVIIEPRHMDRFSSLDLSKAQDIFEYAYQYTKDNFSIRDFNKSAA